MLKVHKKHPDAVLPSKAHDDDVGYDLTIISKYKELSDTVTLYDTGIAVTPPKGYYVEITPRSSISKTGYMLANSVGIVDPAYTGILYVALRKVDPSADDISLPSRCCQLILRKLCNHFTTVWATEDPLDTVRGSGGFGSTG